MTNRDRRPSGYCRLWPILGFMALLGPLSGSSIGAQELPFLRDHPDRGPYSCPPLATPSLPSDEARAQAIELVGNGDRAVILGELSRARTLLDRAAELDPTSAEVAYQRARVLQELGETSAGVDEYCRTLSLTQGQDFRDARPRMEALVATNRVSIPNRAIANFEEGLAAADRGATVDVVVAWFERASAQAPQWASPEYNRGVILARGDRAAEAAVAFLNYLELRPDAPDAMAVSRRIGQLQSVAVRDGPSPVVAMSLGLVIPGMGHLYSGRPLTGLGLLSLAGGAVAAGFLVKEVNVDCLGSVEPGQRCPEDQVSSRRTTRPYVGLGLGVAAAVGVLGAIEAYVVARRNRTESRQWPVADRQSGPTVAGPSLDTHSGRIDLSLVRLRFR